MANVAFICPNCGHTYEFAANLAGKRGRCKVCQKVFRIPEPPASAPVRASVPQRHDSPPALSARPAPEPAFIESSTGADRSANDRRIVFNCPTCGHGYRLASKLAGKQGRCTVCKGIFTIPVQFPPAVASVTPATSPAPIRQPPGRGAAAAPPVAGDSGWWELDSSEAIPIPPTRPGAARARSVSAGRAVVADVSVARDRTTFEPFDGDDERALLSDRPRRPQWVKPAAIGGGVVAGMVVFGMTFALLSGAFGPDAKAPVADSPEPEKAAPAEPVAATSTPSTEPAPAPPPTAAAQHREVVDALIRAYNGIADGYARIRDAGTIRQGSEQVARAAEELRSSARRGRSLAAMSPSERQKLARQSGPRLLEAVDRILGELQRLKTTPGLRCEFDRLIEAYTKTRQEIQRETEHK